MDDNDLRMAISNEFGTVNSGKVDGVHYAGHECRRYNDLGGKNPRFTFGPWDAARVATGPDLVNRSRSVLALPAPGRLGLAAAPAVMSDPDAAGCVARDAASREAPAEQLALI